MMNLQDYESQFDDILEGKNSTPPYDTDEYREYVRMNQVRINRWNKKAKLLPKLVDIVSTIADDMHWLIITEPWCGDAACSNPFITQLAALNPKITLEVQNRDSPESEIDKYLTNGTKSIPKLVVRDSAGNDLFTWGPRPKILQESYLENRKQKVPQEDILKDLQLWYNKNKGVDLQEELYELFSNV